MDNIQLKASEYAKLKGPRYDYDTVYYQSHECGIYDAFLAGAMAPETEEYYRAKFSSIFEGRNRDMSIVVNDDKVKAKVMLQLKAGKKLLACKTWAEYHPGLGLKASYYKIQEFELELSHVDEL